MWKRPWLRGRRRRLTAQRNTEGLYFPGGGNFRGIDHALRIGLCQKVDVDVLTIPEATRIFEDMRQALVERRKKKKMAEEKMKEKEL